MDISRSARFIGIYIYIYEKSIGIQCECIVSYGVKPIATRKYWEMGNLMDWRFNQQEWDERMGISKGT